MASVAHSEESQNEFEAGSARDDSPIFMEQDSDDDALGQESNPRGEDQEAEIEQEEDQHQRAGDGENGDDGGGGGVGDSSDSSSDSDSDSGQEAGDTSCSACLRTLQRVQRLQRRIGNKNDTLRDKKAEIKRLKEMIRHLRAQLQARRGAQPGNDNEQAQDSKPRQSERTWPGLLRQFTNGQADYDYTHAWRKSNMEENISVNLRCVHPNIRLVAPEIGEMSQDALQPNTAYNESLRFEWSCLPQHVQLRIFTYLMKMDRCIIHVFSRLDPYNEVQPDPPSRSQSGLPARFFISDVSDGKALVSLSNATDPALLLRPLLTCKQWCFFLSHIFYGTNTFSFSSHGEFGRFCNGIGSARVQRLQYLELNWKGGVYKATFPAESQNNPKYRNLHTFPLIWLGEMKRLRCLVVWVSETGKAAIRRPWEPASHIRDMKRKTAGQPNARMTRSMRSLLGLDYLLTLRGMHFLRFYNSDLMVSTENRKLSKLRDQSFQLDIDNCVLQQKVPLQARSTELYRLDELIQRGG